MTSNPELGLFLNYACIRIPLFLESSGWMQKNQDSALRVWVRQVLDPREIDVSSWLLVNDLWGLNLGKTSQSWPPETPWAESMGRRWYGGGLGKEYFQVGPQTRSTSITWKLPGKVGIFTLTSVAQSVGCQHVKQKVAHSIPGQDTCLACGPGTPNRCFSPLSPSLPLSKK